jgi:hypothetical protein
LDELLDLKAKNRKIQLETSHSTDYTPDEHRWRTSLRCPLWVGCGRSKQRRDGSIHPFPCGRGDPFSVVRQPHAVARFTVSARMDFRAVDLSALPCGDAGDTPLVADLDKHRPTAVPTTRRRLKRVCVRRGIEDVPDPSAFRQGDRVVTLSQVDPVRAMQGMSLRADPGGPPAHDAHDAPQCRAFMDTHRFDIAHRLGELDQGNVVRRSDEVEERIPFARRERSVDHFLWRLSVSGMDNNVADSAWRTPYHDVIDRLLPAHRMGSRDYPLRRDEDAMALSWKIRQSGKVRKVHSVLQVRNVVADNNGVGTEGSQ